MRTTHSRGNHGYRIVIHGKIAEKQFISDEPMPNVEGPAELIVYPKTRLKKGRRALRFSISLARLSICGPLKILTLKSAKNARRGATDDLWTR